MEFSVLLSVYKNDTASMLHLSLYSIYDEQTIKPSQIILVEDGPLNLSLYAELDYWEKKLLGVLKRIPLANNAGLGRALNQGLRFCSNEWIFRMDADDICLPNRFVNQIEFIKRNPNIDIFSGQIQEFSTDISKTLGVRKLPLIHGDIIKFARWRCPFNHMAIAYKKSVVEAVGGYQHHLWMEDYNLWLRILAAGYKSANLPDVLVYARAGSDMIKRRHGWKYVSSEWKLFKMKYNLGFQSIYSAFLAFLLRSIPRLLPNFCLGKVYAFLRERK